MEPSLCQNDYHGSTDPAENKLKIEEKKQNESESETESESDDAFFDGISKVNAENIRSQISKIKQGLCVQIEQQGREEQERVKQKFKMLCNATDIKDEEAKFTVDFCRRHDMNIDEQIEREGLSFLELMREMMKHDPEEEQKNSYLGDLIDSDNEEKAPKSADEDFEPNSVAKPRRKRRASEGNSDVKPRKKTGYNLDGSKRVKRILLDEALKNKDTNMDDWSEARKKAYKAIKQNPNAYHYRFNKPGEAQAKGGWTKDEHKRFMQVLLEKGANKNWGLFSINVKGRVGYQCSNYYRLLVKHIKIWDPNYWYDGKLLHFKRNTDRTEAWMKFAFTVLEDSSGVFGKPPGQHPKRPNGLASPEEVARIAAQGFPLEPPEGFEGKSKGSKTGRNSKKRKAPKTSNRSSRKYARSSKSEEEDRDVYFAAVVTTPAESAGDVSFPKFIDPFTKFEIKTPAISPHGHVCEYDTWTKVLRTPGSEDTCPFTRKRVTRRQLVKLTLENIEEFKAKIINQDKAINEWEESQKAE